MTNLMLALAITVLVSGGAAYVWWRLIRRTRPHRHDDYDGEWGI